MSKIMMFMKIKRFSYCEAVILIKRLTKRLINILKITTNARISSSFCE